MGRYLKNTNRARIQLVGGAAWLDTSYQQSSVPINHQNTAAALIYADVSVLQVQQDQTSMQSPQFYPRSLIRDVFI